LTLFFSHISFYTCTDRERRNPLDPENTKTRGQIRDFKIRSLEQKVQLSWQKVSLEGLDAINIYRKSEDESVFTRISEIDPDASTFTDQDVEYERQYQYYVTARADDYETPPSAIQSITPGPTYTWVLEGQRGYVSRYTHDLSVRLLHIGAFSALRHLAVVPQERSAWIFSQYVNSLYKIDQAGQIDLIVRDQGPVSDMGVDERRGEVWLAQPSLSRVRVLNRFGNLSRMYYEPQRPVQLAVDSSRRWCWVLDDSLNNLVRLSHRDTAVMTGLNSLKAPKDISLSASGNAAWIADSSRVLKFDFFSLTQLLTVDGFDHAALIQCDGFRDNIWVVDLAPAGQPARLIKMNGQGQKAFELSLFGYPRSLAINTFNGSCLVADTGYQAVWRVSEDGAQVTEIGDFSAPVSIAVEHH
jgi:hypothetical protein